MIGRESVFRIQIYKFTNLIYYSIRIFLLQVACSFDFYITLYPLFLLTAYRRYCKKSAALVYYVFRENIPKEDMSSMLELQHICFSVPSDGGTNDILNDVSLTVPDGRLLVLTGPVLLLWLGGTLPPQALAFTRCVAVHYFFDALIGPLHTAIVATGRILGYNVCISVIMASSFFLAWACLAGGLPAWTSIASVAAVNVIAFLYRLHYVRRHLGVAVLPLLRKAFFPATVFHVE